MLSERLNAGGANYKAGPAPLRQLRGAPYRGTFSLFLRAVGGLALAPATKL